ncbi:MAG: glutamine synthetase III [Victivallales bacterium]|nr:glutamine synthetase III [Victivallales bacterium]
MQKRFDAVCKISDRRTAAELPQGAKVLEYYAEDVFDIEKMAAHLPKSAYKKLMATMNGMQPLDPSIADDVATAMKEWAVSRGATHYTHWFQPLTGGTAEKHDSFLEFSGDKAIFEFSGKTLTVGEPDASSFPSGGLRSTFEARGYTAWDPTSPAFIKHHANGATLCIPTVFCSYTGEVLDKKTPLLRSTQVLKRAVTRLMKCFKQPEEPVKITLGVEQEYFLVDKKFYLQRPDLLQTGRTLYGAPPAKHQQLEDHYFGSIPPRILAFMTEVEQELWKLGIPAKTRHNEVAPAQFELAPIYEDLNLAVDHNMLVMEVLRQTAERNGLVCLLHEKPFAGINGSGKHNNWGIAYGKKNLLDPGSDPAENAIFLTVLTAVIHALDLHSDLLRTATSGIGNDHRLGANEAPPAIISMFVGEQLQEVIEKLTKGTSASNRKASALRIGIDALPPLNRDATDRNRTSPFAFTGNKFEFRAPGSSQSCAEANMILNTIVAEALDELSDQIEKFKEKTFHAELQALLKREISAHQRVIFNGDGYKQDWIAEATKRGLPNLTSTPEAIKPLLDKDNQKLFERYGVLNKTELESRYEVFREDYERRLEIEGRVALELAKSVIRPVVLKEYLTLKSAGSDAVITPVCIELAEQIDQMNASITSLQQALDTGNEIREAIGWLRRSIDTLEGLIDDSVWPLPKYREMLFIY